MTAPENDFHKQIREAPERAQKSLNQTRADNAGKIDKNGKPISNDGLLGAAKSTGSAVRELASNIAVVAGFIGGVQKRANGLPILTEARKWPFIECHMLGLS